MLRRALSILLLLLAGCSKSSERRPPIDKVEIVATVYPLAQLAQAVGGPVVSVRWLVESGQTLRGIGEESRSSMQTARLILYNSGSTEPWIGGETGMSLGGERLLRLDGFPSAHNENPSGFLWLDPLVMREAATELHNRLLALRPRQQAILNDRTDAFTADLDDLTQSELPKFDAFAGAHVLAFRHDFDPMLARLRLLPEVPLDRVATDLNDGDIEYLRNTAAGLHTKVLLISDDTPPATRERLRGIGQTIVAIDTLGSSATSGRDTYPELMRFNYDALLNGLMTTRAVNPR